MASAPSFEKHCTPLTFNIVSIESALSPFGARCRNVLFPDSPDGVTIRRPLAVSQALARVLMPQPTLQGSKVRTFRPSRAAKAVSVHVRTDLSRRLGLGCIVVERVTSARKAAASVGRRSGAKSQRRGAVG